MIFGIKQQSDTQKILTIAAAGIVCLALFSVMLYAFYWDDNTPSNREGKNEAHSTAPAGEKKPAGDH